MVAWTTAPSGITLSRARSQGCSVWTVQERCNVQLMGVYGGLEGAKCKNKNLNLKSKILLRNLFVTVTQHIL